MTNKQFPKDFMFGTALASYQVEGGIYNNDWTHWENKDSSVCAEPCNEACKHYEYYKEDIELLVELGIKTKNLPANPICVVSAAPFVPLSSFVTCTIIS